MADILAPRHDSRYGFRNDSPIGVAAAQGGDQIGFMTHHPDWASEDAYWREHHAARPYVVADRGYAHYQPAYRYGFEAALNSHGESWDEIEADLRRGWETPGQHLEAAWDEIKDAVHDAWSRVTNLVGHPADESASHPRP